MSRRWSLEEIRACVDELDRQADLLIEQSPHLALGGEQQASGGGVAGSGLAGAGTSRKNRASAACLSCGNSAVQRCVIIWLSGMSSIA